jgi:hypothetical protein
MLEIAPTEKNCAYLSADADSDKAASSACWKVRSIMSAEGEHTAE